MTARKVFGYSIIALPVVAVLALAAIEHGVMFSIKIIIIVAFVIGCGFLGGRLVDE